MDLIALRELLRHHPEVVFAFGFAAFCLGILVTWLFTKWLRAVGGARNYRKGGKAERKALKFLKKKGYRILENQPQYFSKLCVNGRMKTFPIRPDLLVEKEGRTYLVEVKSPCDGKGIAAAAIRRQVLEYLHASRLPCLLVLMPDRRLDLIELDPIH